MSTRIRETKPHSKKQRLLLCGFGIGLSWGTALIEIEGAKFPELILA